MDANNVIVASVQFERCLFSEHRDFHPLKHFEKIGNTEYTWTSNRQYFFKAHFHTLENAEAHDTKIHARQLSDMTKTSLKWMRIFAISSIAFGILFTGVFIHLLFKEMKPWDSAFEKIMWLFCSILCSCASVWGGYELNRLKKISAKALDTAILSENVDTIKQAALDLIQTLKTNKLCSEIFGKWLKDKFFSAHPQERHQYLSLYCGQGDGRFIYTQLHYR